MLVSWFLRVLLAGSIYLFLWAVFRFSREEAQIQMEAEPVANQATAVVPGVLSPAREVAVFQARIREDQVFYKGARVADGENITISRRVGVGRSGNNELVIDNPHVSLHHAEIKWEHGLWVRDLHSVNGTFVNQQKIAQKTALEPGDVLEIGPLTLVVVR
jgi:hypothetical protein